MQDRSYSKAWFELAVEISTLAKQSIALSQFEQEARLAPVVTGKNYFDRMRVLSFLINEGFIVISSEKRLEIASKFDPSWLISHLETGSPEAWNLAFVLGLEQIERKFSNERLVEIGLSGEEYVISQIKDYLDVSRHDLVKHVSKTDDTAGYDILSPSLRDLQKRVLLEVKTTVIPSDQFRFYLSRNEFQTSQRYRNWYLLGVTKLGDKISLIGYIRGDTLKQMVPEDNARFGSWESAKIVIPKDFFVEGLP